MFIFFCLLLGGLYVSLQPKQEKDAKEMKWDLQMLMFVLWLWVCLQRAYDINGEIREKTNTETPSL